MNAIVGALWGGVIGLFLFGVIYWDALSLMVDSPGGFAQNIAGAVLQGKAEKYIGGGILVGAIIGLGGQLQKPKERPSEVPASAPEKTVEERLAAIDDLRAKGMIDADEFETKKRFILRDV